MAARITVENTTICIFFIILFNLACQYCGEVGLSIDEIYLGKVVQCAPDYLSTLTTYITTNPTRFQNPSNTTYKYTPRQRLYTLYVYIYVHTYPAAVDSAAQALFMPRLSTSTILKAHRENPFLPLLLRECRSLNLARNELRWLRARALDNKATASKEKDPGIGHRSGWMSRLRSMCRARSRGVPLQYILGDQPFGDLEILCERGVLIPRSAAFFQLVK